MIGGLVGPQVIYPELSYQTIGVLFDAYNELGFGHRENHYQRAAARLLSARGIFYRQQVPYKIISRRIWRCAWIFGRAINLVAMAKTTRSLAPTTTKIKNRNSMSLCERMANVNHAALRIVSTK